MSHFASSNYRSVLTRRDAMKVGGFAMPYVINGHAINRCGWDTPSITSFVSDGNAIPEVFA